MNPKKIIAILIALVLVLSAFVSLVACNKIEVTSVDFDRTTITLSIGSEVQLIYTVLPAKAAGENARWISSDSSIVTVNNGVAKGISEGTAAIRVTIGGKSAICKITVVDPSTASVEATSISLNKRSISLAVGDTETLQATVEPSNTTNKNVAWSSSNESVASVGSNGTVLGVGGGIAVIEARTSNGFTASCVVTVSGQASISEKLYVRKVSSLEGRDDFIMGMDASAVLSLEDAGVKYKDFEGNEQDVFQILKENGITDIRIRVWNDPTDINGNSYGGGNCDINNAVEISKRCEAVGLGVIIDFHYSDFWADPGKQVIPKAWQGKSTTEVANLLYAFTKESLEKVKATGVKITMVQVGNETTSAMAGSKDWTVICNYMNQGSKAVREVTGAVKDGGAKVAVHFTNAGNNGYMGHAQTLANNNVDYDVFGSSWYAYYSSHGTIANCVSQLKNIHEKYGKEVMILETAYAFSEEDYDGNGNTALETTTQPVTIQGQSNAVRDVISAIADLGTFGLGVCYWEGTWIAASTSTNGAVNREICKEFGCGWATSYAKEYDSSANDGGCVIDNQAFWMSDGTPLESLKVFKLVRDGQITDIKADYLEDQEVYYTVNEGPIVLPEEVNVVLNNGSRQSVAVRWIIEDADLTQYIAAVNQYDVVGTTDFGGECHCYVWVMNVNILTEGSFENFKSYADGTTNLIQSDLGDWNLKYTNSGSGDLQLYVSNNAGNARMGSNSFHFWDSGVIDFELSQTISVSNLSKFGYGNYGCSFDFQGNDGVDLDIYSFITLTYANGQTKTFKGNNIEMQGWQKWVRTSVTGVEIDDTVVSVTVGIHVYANASGNGPWGNIDNAQFYFEG